MKYTVTSEYTVRHANKPSLDNEWWYTSTEVYHTDSAAEALVNHINLLPVDTGDTIISIKAKVEDRVNILGG